MDRIMEQVQSGDFDPIKEFTGNKDKFLEVKTAIESISNNLPKEVCIKFILTKIVPTIFNKNTDNLVRDATVDIGLHILQFVNISVLSTKEQEQVFTAIEETYTKVIGELRDSNYADWHKLWIFVIKLCSDKLHQKMGLANKLLRLVEVAFRNSTSIEQRLQAYDCWIELINNSSLNMDHMCSAKQIKLLVTPMKAKFSRMPIVIKKRCDTFVYLLEKLQEKATLCLKEFLEFCFGPFDQKNDGERLKQGRSVPEVCNKSTRVLLEIIGHSHENSEYCLKSDDLHLYKPLISNANFGNFAEIIINSVIECCVLLNEWSQNFQTNDTIIKCLWRSLLGLVSGSDEDVKKKCCLQITSSLKRLLETSRYNEHLHIVLINIIDLLIQDKLSDKFKDIIFDVSINLLHNFVVDSSSFDLKNIKKFVISCFNPTNESKFDKIASNSYKNCTKCKNLILCEIWLKCKITIVSENITNFIWSIRHLQNFKDSKGLISKWTKIYNSDFKTDNLKITLLQELEKLFMENPLLNTNIIQFLEFVSSLESNASKDFVTKFMKVSQLILTLPNLSDENVEKLSALILLYCNQNQYFYKSESNEEAIDKLCGCLEHLISIHKNYKILTELTSCLIEGEPKNLAKFSKSLMSLLESLMLNEDNTLANNTRKLIELLENKEKDPNNTSISSRSLRMINMANISTKSKKSPGQTNILKSSPLSLKTSTPYSRKPRILDHNRKKDAPILLKEDNSSDYVKIDTEVKINVDKLSEHQKEVFTKKRDDIPALYQDLTQSQSQDFLKNIAKVQLTRLEHPELKSTNDNSIEEQLVAKKRKRNSDSSDEKITKETKLSDSTLDETKIEEADTQTQIDTDITQILDVPLEPISKEPPEDLLEVTPKVTAEEKPNEPNKIPDQVENDTTVDKIVGESPVLTPEKKIEKPRRGRRTTVKLINDESENIDKPDISTKYKENDENTNNENKTEEQLLGLKENSESGIRKSTRKIKLRNSDYVDRLRRKREKNEVKRSQSLILKSSPNFVGKSKRKVNESPRKKQTKEEYDGSEDSNESISELLAKIDRRIEENKRMEREKSASPEKKNKTELADGNQNKIIVTPTKVTGEKKSVSPNLLKKTESSPVASVCETPDLEITPINNVNKDSSLEVFEFKAQDVSPSSEESKKLKKKRREIFSSSDYKCYRRRRRVKKEDGKAYTFHVTADSSVPLSESQSLRAVPSSENETITILITRSPPDLNNIKNNDSNTIVTPTLPKRRGRKKKVPQPPNSQDIIESSQPKEISSPRKTRQTSKILKQPTIDEIIKPKEEPPKKDGDIEKTQTVPESLDLNSEKENEASPAKLSKKRRLSLTEFSTQKIELGKRVQRSRSLDKLDFTEEIVSFSTEKLSQNNKKEEIHVNDTSTDTLTLDSQEITENSKSLEKKENLDEINETSINTKDELPSSPITCDTPDRNIELLNSTSDLSPISSVPEELNTAKALPNEVVNVRVARLLQMVNSNVQVKSEGRWFGNKHSSPSSSKVRKMKTKKEENLDILTFSREVPSPLVLPSSGILKRKLNSAEDIATPSPKRKRVNFSDPATTEKKIFIKDSEEYSTELKVEASTEEINDKQETNASILDSLNHDPITFNLNNTYDFNMKDETKLKLSVKNILQHLKVPDILDVVSDYLTNSDLEKLEELKKSPDLVINFVGSLLEHVPFENLLPKLLQVLEKLSDEEISSFRDEIKKIIEIKKIEEASSSELNTKSLQEQISELDCDKMNNLIKNYFSGLEDKKRNDFLVGLLNLASAELPVNKEYINSHVQVLQKFLNRMSD